MLGFAQTPAALPKLGFPIHPPQMGPTGGQGDTGRHQLALSGLLLLPPRCWSCQDVVKQIRGFQTSRKEDLEKELRWEINLSAGFCGYRTLNLIQQELVEVEGDGKARNFYKSCIFCDFDLPHLTEGGSQGSEFV